MTSSPLGLAQQPDQPNPYARPARADQALGAPLTLIGGGARPIGSAEQTLPTLAIVRRQDVAAAHNLVLGLDRFPPGQAGVGPEYDWTNPVLAVVRRADQALAALTLLGAGGKPFSQIDQPNPGLGVVRRADASRGALTVTGGGAAPFNQADQPNPGVATIRRPDQAQGALTQIGGGAKPFGLTDQPNPVLSLPRRPGEGLRSFTLYAVIRPFAPVDQPVPAAWGRRTYEWGPTARALYAPAQGDVGRSAALSVTFTGLSATGAAPAVEADLGVTALGPLAIDGARALIVSPGGGWTGKSAARNV